MRLFKEPLVHFFILGAALFAVFSFLNGTKNQSPDDIIITQGQIQALAESFKVAQQRTPNEEEVKALVQEHIREEVYVREALALGLDNDDLIIRRRLRQKMEFILDDHAALTEPTDAQLMTFWQENPQKYQEETRFTFTQVYLNPIKHRNLLASEVDTLLTGLTAVANDGDLSNAPANLLGDGLLLQRQLDNVTASELDKIFGGDFSQQLENAALNQWSGSYTSGYGVHVVYVAEKIAGTISSFYSVRDLVSRDWRYDNQLAANETYFQTLLARYHVIVE